MFGIMAMTAGLPAADKGCFMKTVDMTVKVEKNPSRVELIIRLIWMMVCGFVLAIFGVIAEICWVIQFIYILILGKRMDALDPWIAKVVKGGAKLNAYAALLTDERPPLVPED
jgi:hypothetical protein